MVGVSSAVSRVSQVSLRRPEDRGSIRTMTTAWCRLEVGLGPAPRSFILLGQAIGSAIPKRVTLTAAAVLESLCNQSVLVLGRVAYRPSFGLCL